MKLSFEESGRTVEIWDVSTDTQECYRVVLGDPLAQFLYIYQSKAAVVEVCAEWCPGLRFWVDEE